MSNDIPDYNPFHGDPTNSVAPFRPSLANLGGGAYENDADHVPDVQTQPSAEMENVGEKVLQSVATTAAVAVIAVIYTAGTPSIANAWFADNAIAIGDLTVTDNADGDTSITWAADTFPPLISAMLALNDSGSAEEYAALIANGVRVHTNATVGGAGADVDFTVSLY